ncbi:MAG: hypothetical protein F6K55_07400 [Moorea sp. SIO4A3]|nr:hypothetical protein [Moorena sp. SIO4A3]
MGRWGDGDGEMGRWGDGEMGRWGDGEMGRWGDGGNHLRLSLHPLWKIIPTLPTPF